MSNVPVEEVERLLLAHDDEGYSSTWFVWKYETPSEGVPVAGLGTVFLEKEYGGESQGEEYWMVLRVVNGDSTRFFRIDGYYVSFDGGNFDGPFHEVSPIEKLVTYYE